VPLVSRRAAGLVLALCGPLAALAQTPPPTYLTEFPAPARVMADIRDENALGAMAHRIAALNRLRRMVEELSGQRRYRNQLSEAETRLIDDYDEQSRRLQQEVIAGFDPRQTGLESPRAKWFLFEAAYEGSDVLRDELLKRYFSPKFRTLYFSAVQTEAVRVEMIRREGAAPARQEPPR
jgi:hypothetical protein